MQVDVSNAKKPVKLVGLLESGKEAHVWACGACGYTALNEQMAVECCAPHLCDCGKRLNEGRYVGGWTKCQECRDKEDNEKLAHRFDAAKKRVTLKEYVTSGGQHLYDPCSGDYVDADDLDSYFDKHEFDPPTLLFGCTEMHFSAPDARDFINDQLERQEFHDDAYDWVTEEQTKELQDFLNTWSSKLKLHAYMADDDVVVDVSEVLKEWQAEKTVESSNGVA